MAKGVIPVSRPESKEIWVKEKLGINLEGNAKGGKQTGCHEVPVNDYKK